MKRKGENFSGHLKESTFRRLRSSKTLVLSLALTLCLAIGFLGFAQVNTTTTLASSSNPSVFGQTVDFTATVANDPPGGPEAPSGTMTFYDGATFLGTADLSDVSVFPVPPLYQATLSVSTLSVGSHTITAVYPGDADTNPSTSDSLFQTVNKAGTSVYIQSDVPDPSVLGQSYLVTGDVDVDWPGTGYPTGTVTVHDGQGNSCVIDIDPVTGDWSCGLSATSASTTAGLKTLSASYSGDGNFVGSSDTEPHTYTDPATRTEVMGADTPLIVNNTATFTVEVVDTSDPFTIPAGTVNLSVSPSGQGDLSATSCILDAAGRCTFTYTPTSGDPTPHAITAVYSGAYTTDDPPVVIHEPSTGTYVQEIVKRAADIALSCSPTTAYISQGVTCEVQVEDDTTAPTPEIPQGTVTFDDGGRNGVFSVGGVPGDVWPLDGSGVCTVTYTPGAGDEGTTTIVATYSGSSVHTSDGMSQYISVELRPTQTRVECSMDTILVNETLPNCSVTVEDISGVGTATPPVGLLAYTTSLPAGEAVIIPGGLGPVSASSSEAIFSYVRIALDADAGFDIIQFDYTAADGIHADSAGAFAQGIKRRPTVITLNCTPDCTPGTGGAFCTATVSEDGGNAGVPAPVLGELVLLGDPDTTVCGPTNPSCPFHVDSEALSVNVTVRFDPTDKVHLASTGSESVNRADCFDPDQGGDGTDGSGCNDGCGSGGVNITQMLQNYRSLAVAINAVKMGLEQFRIILSLFPDPIVGAGVFVIAGTTIPAKDIAAAVIAEAQLALSIELMVITTDIDGDGLLDIVERHVTDTDYDKRDTDSDGMSDGLEILVAGGYYGGTRRPDPTDSDSDNDGLLDGEEWSTYDTNPCVADTDCDGVIDGLEVDTWVSADLRNHADPLKMDTDGDGISDGVEYYMSHSCPFVNDDDSDDDGLQDGYEDANLDGCWGTHTGSTPPWTCIGGITVGNSTTQASKTIGWWETDLCNDDTDGDGLLDGVEEGLFAKGEVTPKGVSTTVGVEGANLGVTVPALDSDMDNDGLSDYVEVNVYQTDPMDADTDDDTVSDGDEIATWAYADARDHSNPLAADTDGDGLTDNIEIAEGCTHVNDDDSDDDGLQDGTESWNGDGTITTGTIGNSTLQADTNPSGETHFCNPDTDGDGLTDGEEVALLGGLPVSSTTGFASVIPQGISTVFGQDGAALTATVPALDDDSDNDGLSDYEEINITGTDPLDADTDNDTISDANELIATGGTWPNRTFIQESDPLDPDTDDDGLTDNIEYPGTGLGITRTTGGTPDNVCPYVNDDDSDDDGLQDGTEGWSGDATITTGTIGNSTTQADTSPATGETDFCDPDTDNDGLTDGEEVALLGGLPVDSTTGFTSVIPQGVSTVFGQDGAALTATVPALDDDSDNDGLSDYEEVNITGTDPLDADSDNDTISDANELIATGGTWPNRTFIQVSDPLDPDTDDDDLHDYIEYSGSGLGISRGTGGTPDNTCPYVNDDDSDDDGLQDGTEDANHDGTWGVGGAGITIGSFGTQAGSTVTYWETDLCNPDTDGDGLLDGEEVALIGGGPILGRPTRPVPGFNTVTPEGVSTVLPMGTGPAGSPPGTGNSQLGPYVFIPVAGAPIAVTIPALDVDSDNDGLSDYEEVNITGTDPLDQDSDNDTLMDSDELIATGGAVDIPGNPGTGPRRTFDQESNPFDINTDDDRLFDPQEYVGSGLSLLAGAWGGARDIACPYVNDDDSDDDSIQDGAVIAIAPAGVVTSFGIQFAVIHYEDFVDIVASDVAYPGVVRTVPTSGYGEQNDDPLDNVCDCDSDGDGLNDGEEIAIGTDPGDWDTDDDGRNDWHEVTGGGPIPTDPFDPDTDDDGLLDSAEVFGTNPTNPLNADTDGDGLCDGGAGTPWMITGDARVVVNPICKSCSTPGFGSCGILTRGGSADGIGDHPNPMGLGEDENGNGAWDVGETDPNQYDTDGDAEGDGIEKLGFSTSRQSWIPSTDMLGGAISVVYPACGCMDPLNPDTDGDGLSDGYEDLNHDGNFDFAPSDFDFQDLLDGAPQPDPEETNPCDPDTDDDGLTDYDERYQSNPAVFYPFNPTNPLDHDTDNDYLRDGEEVNWTCVNPNFDLDPNMDGIDDYFVMTVLGDVLDPTNRDSDSDGFIDGLDPNPCYSWLIPIGKTLDDEWIDEDGDGFSDADELAAGTDPNDPNDHPISFIEDYDRDLELDDSLWLEDYNGDGIVDSVAIDLEADGLVDARVGLVQLRDLIVGDFDGDGFEDDVKLIVVYAFANGRYIQPRVMLTIIDLDSDFIVDEVIFAE